MNIITKDTQLCVSFASNPSNHGVRFHNFLYAKFGIDYIYKACAPLDIAQAVAGIRGLPIRGASVSMPFKEAVIPLVDEVTRSAEAIGSVNTIVNDNGKLIAYNTDYLAIEQLIGEHSLTPCPIILSGSGGMAKAVGSAFADAGFKDGTVVARNPKTGPALAKQLGWKWAENVDDLTAPLIVNVTPVGMADGPAEGQLSYPTETIAAADTVFDVIAKPSETPLILEARKHGKAVVSGAEVIAIQAARQFELYTGQPLSPEDVAEAEAYAQS